MSLPLIPNVNKKNETTLRGNTKSSRARLCFVAGMALGSLFINAHSAQAVPSYSDAQVRSVESDDEQQLNQIRDQEITQLKIVMGRRMSANRRPDILLRLAELYIEKYRHYFLKENEVHQSLIKAGQNPRYVDHTRSRAYLSSATNACLAILKSRVPFAKMAEVYYFLGYNASELEHRDEALRYYRIVVDRYPQSIYTAEAERNIAEAYFDKKQYREAVRWYERAARYKNLASYPRILYKLAWSYFKTKRYADALNSMKRVIVLSGTEGKFVGLREEALHDLVGFYIEAGRYREAREYFSEIPGGTEIYVQSLKRLSTAYERSGRYSQALYVDNELISQYQDSKPELTFDVIAHSVELYRKVGDGPGEEKALTRLVEFFVKHGSKIGSDSEDSKAAFDRTKKYLRSRATEVHKEAQKKKTAALFGRAADLYGLYMKAFLADDDSDSGRRELSEIRVYRADALLQSGRDSEATAELQKTLEGKGDPKNRREAGLTVLNLLLKRIDRDIKAGKATDAELEKRFTEVSETFEDQFSDDPIVPELRYKRARLVVARAGGNSSSKARDVLEEFIEKYPSRPESIEAAQDLVSADVKAGKLDDAVERARKYLAVEALMRADKKGGFRQFLDSVIARKSFAEVQNIEKGNDFEKAAQGFEQLAQNSRDPEVASKSLNNAAVNYEKAGRRLEALRLYETLLHRTRTAPEKDRLRKNLKGLVSHYLWESDFAQAAQQFEHFSHDKEFSDHDRQEFAQLAFQLQWGLGDKARATAVARSTRTSFCSTATSSSCESLLFDLVNLFRESGQVPEAVQLLKSYLSGGNSSRRGGTSSARVAEADFILGSIYEASGDARKAVLYYEEATRVSSRDRSEAGFAARAAFILVEPFYKKFMNLKLEQPDQVLKSRTKEKLNLLESLVTRYEHVVAFGDGEWGIAALERLGSAFSSFATELQNAPAPSSLQGQGPQLEQYRRGLMGVAGPMSERGREFLNKAHKKGLSLEVFSLTFVRVTEALARRDPHRYPPAHFSLESHKGDDGPAASQLRLMGDAQEPGEEWRRKIAQRLAGNSSAADAWIELGNCEVLSGRLRLGRMFYSQALTLNSKSQAATNNLAVLSFLEGHSLEGGQGFLRAVERGEFARESRLNLVKVLLAYHHFDRALENGRILVARLPADQKDDRDVKLALAVAALGTGNFGTAGPELDSLDAKGSNSFTLWYNWNVWALIAGDKGEKEEAREKLQDKQQDDLDAKPDRKLSPLEREMLDLALSLPRS